MMSKTLALGLLLAYAEARFGQEQVPVAAIQALSNFGNPGEAATLAGAVPGVLLAAANACAQVELADQIVATLGNDQQVINAAKQLIAAEKNFNPFAVDIPSICDDATLPATEELRGVIPIVDPAVAGSDVQNANSATSLTTPFNADGLSIADISIAQGFDNFTAQASDGSTAPAGNAAAGGNAAGDDAAADNGADNAANDGAAADNGADADAGNNNNAQNGGATQCGGGRNNNNNNNGNGNNNNNNNNNNNGNNNNGNGNNNNNNNNNDAADDAAGDDAAADNGADNAANDGAADDAANDGANNGAAAGAAGLTASSNAALDFGTCNPAMSFVGGRANRAADEFTFNSVDPAILAVQQEALNPNIITNRICDEVQNRCGANDAAIQACLDAKADLLAQDVNAVKVAATATNWNTALGFENVDIAAIDGGVDGAANDGAADDAANDGAADDAANDGAADDAANDGAANNGAANDGAADDAANDGAADDAANDGANNGAAAGTAALDFGTCNPAMSFIGGRGNRAADEFTFNSVDPAILAVQQEALNPNIITNRICDEVQNRCGANDAAIQACLDAKADLLAQDINAVKVAATATNWNTALGFGNVDISQETA